LNPRLIQMGTSKKHGSGNRRRIRLPQETQHEHEAEQESLSLACVSRCMVLGNSSNRDNPIKDMINFVNFTLSIVIGIRITAGDSTIYL
jgi:hypothetical protein